MQIVWFHRLTSTAVLLAFGVIVLGAYVRLAGAGLGCPDWPGCYGHLGVPETIEHVTAANEAFPERPVESGKAWKEMVHRYFAGLLGLLVLAILMMAVRLRSRLNHSLFLPVVLSVVIIAQALLGMWTVTLLLKPLIVLLHLLGGLSTIGLLWWMWLRQGRYLCDSEAAVKHPSKNLQRLAVAALIGLVVQICLGGWTSTNYAAVACPDFPTCQGQYWPAMNFTEGFTLWCGLGIDYEGGVLDHPARVAIHFSHRLGAILAGGLLILLAIRLMIDKTDRIRRMMGGVLLLAVCVQITLGVSAVLGGLPLVIAVLHNAGAALLWLVSLAILHILNPPRLRGRMVS